jgi:hypothetical protein
MRSRSQQLIPRMSFSSLLGRDVSVVAADTKDEFFSSLLGYAGVVAGEKNK